METIKSWAALVGATSIVATVFLALLPGGKMKAAFSSLAGIVFVCALISPFSQNSSLDFDFDNELFVLTEANAEYLKQNDEAAKAVAQNGYEEALKTVVENLGYSDFKAEVICAEDLKVESVNVIFKTDFDEEKVKGAIKKICKNAAVTLSKGESDE